MASGSGGSASGSGFARRVKRAFSSSAKKGKPVFDGDVWSISLGKHSGGKYSFAASQANQPNEDVGQVEVGQCAIFAGVYDGYMSKVVENNRMSVDVIRAAFALTEDNFIQSVQQGNNTNPLETITGACCLIGVLWNTRLYVANLGDSRAVLGSVNTLDDIISEQLTVDHSVNNSAVREQFLAGFPEVEDKSTILSENPPGCYRINNQIQATRAIGHAFLKCPDVRTSPWVLQRIARPLLSAEPDVYVRDIQHNDKFVIFASDGLWARLSNQEATRIVHTGLQEEAAKRLVMEAKKRVAEANGMTYEQLRNLEVGHRRREFHDDITVVVLFFDQSLLRGQRTRKKKLKDKSRKSFIMHDEDSWFNMLKEKNPDEWPPAS